MTDQSMDEETKGPGDEYHPPIGGAGIMDTTGNTDNAQLEPGHKPSPDRIRSHDNASLDEYAADKEAVRVDDSAEIKNTRVQAKQLNSSSSSGVQEKLKTEVHSAKELEIMANREKDKGNEAFRAGDYSEAIKYYTRSLSVIASAPAYNNRAQARIRLEQFPSAVVDCNNVLELEPGNLKALLRRGTALKSLQQYKEAKADLEYVLKVEPANKQAKDLLDDVKRELNASISVSSDRKNPSDVLSKETTGDVVRTGDEGEQAPSKPLPEKALSSKPLPEKVVLLKDEGMPLYKAGQYDLAREKYTTALNILQQDQCSYQWAIASLYDNRSACQLELGDFQMCISDCDASLKINPYNVGVYLRRGEAYETLESVAQFLQDQYDPTWRDRLPPWNPARRISATPAQRLSNTGIAAEGSVITGTGTLTGGDSTTGDSIGGNGSSADGESGTSGGGINGNSATTVGGNAARAVGTDVTTTGNIMIQAEPPTKKKPAVSTSVPVTQKPLSKEEQFQTLKSEGKDFVRKGKYKEAIDCYTACADIEPGRAVSFTNRALCYLKLCQYDKAKDDCTSAIQLDPKNVKGFHRRALAEKGLGNYFESINDLSNLLKLDPTNKSAKKELEIVKDIWRKELGEKQTKPTKIPTESNEAPSNKKRNVPIERADSDSEEEKNINDYRDHVDVSQESESFMGMSKGFLLSQPDIPDVSPHCKRKCFISIRDFLLQRLVCGKRTKEEDNWESYLREQEIDIRVGGGSTEKLTIDDACKRYMSAHFKDLDKSAHCFPPVFKYNHQGEPFDVDGKGKISPFPKRKVAIGTLCRERRGEHAEEQTVEAFSVMFSKYDIPSFIIHGHNWKRPNSKAVKNKKDNRIISKLWSKVYRKNGEMDLLISLPRKCMFVVEVKAVQDEQNKEIVRLVSEALSQCQNSADEFLSKIVEWSNPVSLIKVVVLPNCTRATVDRLFCMICRTHVISADELSSVSKLNSWFQRITDQYSAQIESSPLQLSAHLELVGRIIGQASMSEPQPTMRSIEQTVEEIKKYGGSAKVKEKVMAWTQMTPQQLSAKWRDAKFLIVFGPPGSGKTLLALSKAKELLEGGRDDVLYIVCNKVARGLKEMYKVELGKVADDKPRKPRFFIRDFDCHELTPDPMYLFNFIVTLKKEHTGKTVHVILDESLFIAYWIIPLVGMEGVGYLWLLMDPYVYTESVYADIRRSVHRFEVIRLDWVMRMSRQNIKFANAVFQHFSDDPTCEIPELRAGHGVNGVRPVVYRMKCVCPEFPDKHHCPNCRIFRMDRMIMEAYQDLGIDLLECSDMNEVPSGLSLINPYNFRFDTEGMTIAEQHVCSYMGCEDQLVIMDISDLLLILRSLIGLTRSLGKVIIVDGGCSQRDVAQYDDFITMITENPLIVEVKEVRPSDDDLQLKYQNRIRSIVLKVMERSLFDEEVFQRDCRGEQPNPSSRHLYSGYQWMVRNQMMEN